jgi:hypothetical protein
MKLRNTLAAAAILSLGLSPITAAQADGHIKKKVMSNCEMMMKGDMTMKDGMMNDDMMKKCDMMMKGETMSDDDMMKMDEMMMKDGMMKDKM